MLATILLRSCQDFRKQNLQMCLDLAARHYLMDHGLIVYHGTNEEFKANNEVKDRYLALSSLAREFSEKEES